MSKIVDSNGNDMRMVSIGVPEDATVNTVNAVHVETGGNFNILPEDAVPLDTTNYVGPSFVLPEEIAEAEKLITDLLGFKRPRPCNYFLLVKVYVRPDEVGSFLDPVTKEKKSFYLPKAITANDKFRSAVGLVLHMGPRAYQDGHFVEPLYRRLIRKVFGRWMKPSIYQPSCRVGDWIYLPRHEGPQFNYRGVPMMILPDDKVYMTVEDPTFITRD
jgi:hypothetical protein